MTATNKRDGQKIGYKLIRDEKNHYIETIYLVPVAAEQVQKVPLRSSLLLIITFLMTLNSETRILLVDDHHIFNEGLKRLINEQPGYVVCGQVYQSKEIFPAIENQRPHLILLDVNLKGMNGIDIGKKIIKDYPDTKVIVLTMYDQSKLLEESRKIGLHGYLLKDATTIKLLSGIEKVLDGQYYFDDAITGVSQENELFIDTFAQKLNLTFREIEIIRLIKNGHTNEQIAEQLHLSFFTIKTHRKNIHFKLGLSKVTELIDFAIKNGI